MNQNCLASIVLYEAKILDTKVQLPDMKYISLCETTFKIPYANNETAPHFHLKIGD